jgi:hypothetical protein
MRTASLTCAAVIALTAGAALAGPNQATMAVSATVVARAVLTVDYQSPTLTITEGDISRGYVDVPAASRVTVRCNALGGYVLTFEGSADFFRQVRVTGLPTEAVIGGHGGWLPQPYSRNATAMDLSYRFILGEGARPGTYGWPLALSVALL